MPVWQQSFELLIRIYKTTKNYPSDERFGLISDMRRSANSIAHPEASGLRDLAALSLRIKHAFIRYHAAVHMS
ncbi:MAG: four helix bundle protein [Candidatus Marinimicrobia bacterium]|nr:four helix bundle protein [Candidatus Neomarinimicrobiota bacterium]